LAAEEHDEFRRQYAHARECQADFYAEQIVDIADGKDKLEVTEGEPVLVRDHNRDRLRIDARKWFASKLAPKKYGDKVAVGGADDLPPIASTLTVEFV
jgi:hypothetical protein